MLIEEAKQLPIYQTDFKGKLIDGLVYHEPWPVGLPQVARECQWKGGHHTNVSPTQLYDHGGSFGPICLYYLKEVSKYFELK